MALIPSSIGNNLGMNINVSQAMLQNQYGLMQTNQSNSLQLMQLGVQDQYSNLQKTMQEQHNKYMQQQLVKAIYVHDPFIDHKMTNYNKGIEYEPPTNKAWLDQRISEVGFRL